jgi:molybdopterin-guanine dinucleotide biosynthesis protein A
MTETTSLTGLILAGGASSRMGRNKALLTLAGQTLVERVTQALAALTDDILIIANEAEPYRFLDRPIIPDIRPGYGPLMGLYSGLKAARGELALLAAVDMPFLSPDYLRFLLALAPGYDVVIPSTGHRLHPLCAVYRRESCLPAIEQAIARGQRRLIAFHPQMRVRQVDETELRRIDPDLRALMNVNTPEELEAARRLLKG